MNALNMARTAYTKSAAPIRTHRGTEYDAFARITHQLKTVDRETHFSAFAGALHENRKLWNILAIDVADNANGLSKDLRAQIFYLAEFTSLHTSKVLVGASDASALVEINTAIMSGLRQTGDIR